MPYQWLWQRMQQCHLIIALATIAEYGVLKIFQHMAYAPKVRSWQDNSVVPDYRTMNTDVSNWQYRYACSKRKLRSWIANEDWWVMSDSSNRPRWFMLPVHHPASAVGRGGDPEYRITAQRAQRMMAAVRHLHVAHETHTLRPSLRAR